MQRALFLLITVAVGISQAQNVEGYPWCNGCPVEKSRYELLVQSFIDQVKNHQKSRVAGRIRYPLHRNSPVHTIVNEQDMLNKYHAVFNDRLIREISESEPFEHWDVVGYKGIMLNRGTVWMDFEGRIITINTTTHLEIEYQKQVWSKAPVYVVETKKFLIQISKPAEGAFRYTAWSRGANPAGKPDIVLNDGSYITYDDEGTHRYHFVNGTYEYSVSTTPNPEDGRPEGVLEVKRGGKLILSQPVLNYLDSMPSPDWVDLIFENRLSNLYQQSTFISPARYQADFNGDKKNDVAVAVEQKSSGKKGIIILHKDMHQYYVLGAGTEIGNGGDDFSWMDTWSVEDNPTALYVGKMESAGGSIYWTGSGYQWRQSGD